MLLPAKKSACKKHKSISPYFEHMREVFVRLRVALGLGLKLLKVRVGKMGR